MGLFWSRSYLSGDKITKENIIELDDKSIVYTIAGKLGPIIKNLEFDDEIKNQCFEILTKVIESDGFTDIGYYNTKIYSISEYNDIHFLHNSSKTSPTTWGWTLNSEYL
jgi:hypothetical protein